jgi:hypothetical protein
MSNYVIDCLDLETAEVYKIDVHVKGAGGRYSFSESLSRGGTGISGLAYYGHQNDLIKLGNEDIKQSVNIELLKSGILFYTRSRYSNYAFVIKSKNLRRVIIQKIKDDIVGQPSGFYNLALKLNTNYLVARKFITEDKIITLHPVKLIFEMVDGRTINFEIDRYNPQKVINFLMNSTTFEVVNEVSY